MTRRNEKRDIDSPPSFLFANEFAIVNIYVNIFLRTESIVTISIEIAASDSLTNRAVCFAFSNRCRAVRFIHTIIFAILLILINY